MMDKGQEKPQRSLILEDIKKGRVLRRAPPPGRKELTKLKPEDVDSRAAEERARERLEIYPEVQRQLEVLQGGPASLVEDIVGSHRPKTMLFMAQAKSVGLTEAHIRTYFEGWARVKCPTDVEDYLATARYVGRLRALVDTPGGSRRDAARKKALEAYAEKVGCGFVPFVLTPSSTPPIYVQITEALDRSPAKALWERHQHLTKAEQVMESCNDALRVMRSWVPPDIR
jgi:hypothetical protein